MRAPLLAIAVVCAVLTVACATSSPQVEHPDPQNTVEPDYNDPRRKDVEASKGWGKPRPDLHCTPQQADDESRCAAMGADHHFGPPLTCRGIDPGPEVEAEERQQYEAGTNPCRCYSNEEIQSCATVP